MFRIAKGITTGFGGCGCGFGRRRRRREAMVGVGLGVVQLRHGSGGARGDKHVHHHFSMIESATRSATKKYFNFLVGGLYTPYKKGSGGMRVS